MKFRLLGAMAVLFLGAGWAAAQAPAAPNAIPSLAMAAPSVAPPSSPPATLPAPTGNPGLPSGGANLPSNTALPTPPPPANSAGYPPVLGNATVPAMPASAAPSMNNFSTGNAPASGPGYLPSGGAGCPAGPGPGYFFADIEYLLWHVKSDRLPVATTASAAGLSLAINTNQPGPGTATTGGILQPMTDIAPVFITNSARFGNLPNPGEHSGARVTLGYWCDSDRTFGVDGSLYGIERRGSGLTVTTTRGDNQFTVPTQFVNFIQGPVIQVASGTGGVAPQNTFVPQPVIFTGTVFATTIVSNSTWTAGGDINVRCTPLQIGCCQFSALAGFRVFAFDENLDLATQSTLSLTPINPLPVPPSFTTTSNAPAVVNVSATNGVRTHNTFYGGQIGGEFDTYCGRVYVRVQEKVGVGVMHQNVGVDGFTTTSVSGVASPFPPTTIPGGLLVGPGDVGTHSRNRVAFFSDGTVKLGYILTNWLRFHVGYDVLTMTNVARPGSVAGLSTSTVSATVASTSTTVNLTQPSFAFHDSTVWIHGLDFGLELVY
jgi:hypothetical protein